MNRDDLPPSPESCIARAGLIGVVGLMLCCAFAISPLFCYLAMFFFSSIF
jgi:hypothetical protein